MSVEKILKISIIGFILVFLGNTVFSCTVPVFQYALERWNQSYYDGVIFYKGNLTQKEQEAFNNFQDMLHRNNSTLNLRLERLDIAAEPEKYQQLLQGVTSKDLPALALWYPHQKGQSKPFWFGGCQMSVLSNIVGTAKRREISDHLISGSPIVWVFVTPPGQKVLSKPLNRLKENISKTVTEMKQEYQFKSILENGGDQVSFPVVTVSADSPEESVLISMITGLDEVSSVKKPVVIPVFGRGRALTTFTADKINKDMIYNIMSFLLSPCACQIKMASPGTDMLIKANWQKAFTAYQQQDSSPPLTNVSSVMSDSTYSDDSKSVISSENDSIIDLTTDQHSSFINSKIVSSAGGIIGILVIVIGIVTFVILKRK